YLNPRYTPGPHLCTPSPTNPPPTTPPGKPACRMFSQCVLFLRKSVAVSGLMTASQVPLPSEKSHMPMERHQNAAFLPPQWSKAYVVMSVTTADEACSIQASAMSQP